MARAAQVADVSPRQVSFAGAVQTLNVFAPKLELATPADLPRLWEMLIWALGRHRVARRPDRYEPRAVKRRARPMALLTVPRQQARQLLERYRYARR